MFILVSLSYFSNLHSFGYALLSLIWSYLYSRAFIFHTRNAFLGLVVFGALKYMLIALAARIWFIGLYLKNPLCVHKSLFSDLHLYCYSRLKFSALVLLSSFSLPLLLEDRVSNDFDLRVHYCTITRKIWLCFCLLH